MSSAFRPLIQRGVTEPAAICIARGRHRRLRGSFAHVGHGRQVAADGQPIGTFTVHVTIHVTYADVNDNFEPDPDETTVSFDRNRVRCS